MKAWLPLLALGTFLLPTAPAAPGRPGRMATTAPAPPRSDSTARTLAARFAPPPGFTRRPTPPGSFAAFLAQLPLKPHGTAVYYHNGQRNPEPDLAAAVLDFDVGTRDLQQCADAVMRLRAEYLYQQKRYAAIHFNFTNGFRADYAKWAAGQRIRVAGNKASWYPGARPDYSYRTFRQYLDVVFTYAGTQSLSRELLPAPDDVRPGDVFIRGGSPGHAVLVLDVAERRGTGERVFTICQSYMPAQSIHVLVNRENGALSPWYNLADADQLYTPQWTFQKTERRRFPD